MACRVPASPRPYPGKPHAESRSKAKLNTEPTGFKPGNVSRGDASSHLPPVASRAFLPFVTCEVQRWDIAQKTMDVLLHWREMKAFPVLGSANPLRPASVSLPCHTLTRPLSGPLLKEPALPPLCLLSLLCLGHLLSFPRDRSLLGFLTAAAALQSQVAPDDVPSWCQ